MKRLRARLAGVELYFDNLEASRSFYRDVLELEVSREQAGYHAQFDTGPAFLCLEKKGVEPYPSRDKVALFLEVGDLGAAVKRIGRERFAHVEPRPRGGRPAWAVLHDPEGHNVLLLEPRDPRRSHRKR